MTSATPDNRCTYMYIYVHVHVHVHTLYIVHVFATYSVSRFPDVQIGHMNEVSMA